MKKSYLSGLIFCCSLAVFGAQQPEVQSVAGDAVQWRHHLHQNPELSFKEYETSKYVADMLRSFGNIEVVRPTETSVIGILRGGKPGKTVGFRADMDALPVQEETGFSFASRTPGVSHACVHDMHTAMLLGTAKILASMQKELPGTVYFIFQPGEEKSPGGASPSSRAGFSKVWRPSSAFMSCPMNPPGPSAFCRRGPRLPHRTVFSSPFRERAPMAPCP